MTTAQTTQATAESNSSFVKNLNESIRKESTQKTKEQLQAELKKVNDLLEEMENEPEIKTGFNWKSVGKTVGLFAVGAAVGAAGKLAWDHFVG